MLMEILLFFILKTIEIEQLKFVIIGSGCILTVFLFFSYCLFHTVYFHFSKSRSKLKQHIYYILSTTICVLYNNTTFHLTVVHATCSTVVHA